jgi:hypothetical protein
MGLQWGCMGEGKGKIKVVVNSLEQLMFYAVNLLSYNSIQLQSSLYNFSLVVRKISLVCFHLWCMLVGSVQN